MVLADKNPSAKLVKLYETLQELEGKKAMFGQQDGYAMGTDFAENDIDNIGKSDVRSVSGKHAKVAGFDIGHYEIYYTAERDPEFAEMIKGKDRKGIDYEVGENIDGIKWDYMREAIRYAYKKGAIVTISWHSVNPLNGCEYGANNFSWSESVVKAMLPGGRLHHRFLLYLDSVLEFNASLTDEDGDLIPYIFRPFHEHTGAWFWWGIGTQGNPNDGTAWNGDHSRLNDPEDYAALFRFTVEYLQERGMHNVLYCISPDRSPLTCLNQGKEYDESLAEGYMTGYPGDAYVDVFGLDDYWDFGHDYNEADAKTQYESLVATLETTAVLAKEHEKLTCLSEMGIASAKVLKEAGKDPQAPFTEWFMSALSESENTKRMLYGLIWRADFVGEGSGKIPFVLEDKTFGTIDRSGDVKKMAEDPSMEFITL